LYNTKYLQKRGNIYYFVKRINGKIVKISLKSSDLKHCIQLRDRILKTMDDKEKIKQLEEQNLRLIKLVEYYQKTVKIRLDGYQQRLADLQPEHKTELFLINRAMDKLTTLKELEAIKTIKNGNVESNENRLIQPKNEVKNFQLLNELDKHFNNFLEYQKKYKKVTESSIVSYKASYHYLKYFIKQEENFILNFKNFKQIQHHFTKLPQHFFKYKKYYSKPLEKILKLKNIKPLANKTINGHMNNFKTFFDFLIYEEIIENNPLANIKPLPESDEIKRLEYTKAELENIFNSNIEKEYKNMYKIALYTGFRLEEILSLKKKDIKDNFIHLTLKSSNNKNHERIMPIHHNIIKTINYQKRTNKGSYLFFNGNINGNEVKNVGKRLNRKLKNIIPATNKTFHSFRKNFAQELELNTTAEEKIKKYLLGHSFNKDVTHTVYNRGKINTEKLIECINQITFDY